MKNKKTCDACQHNEFCTKQGVKNLFGPCELYESKVVQKICPFERQNREIDGAYCLGSDCAWWDANNANCVVFHHVWDAAESLTKEIETVLHGGIIQGGED